MIIIFLFSMFFSIASFASHYLVPRVIEIEQYASPNQFYQRVGIIAELDSNGDRLSLLKVMLDETVGDIPHVEYQGIHDPNLKSIEVRYGSSKDNHIYIYLEYGGGDESGKTNSALFSIIDGTFGGSENY